EEPCPLLRSRPGENVRILENLGQRPALSVLAEDVPLQVLLAPVRPEQALEGIREPNEASHLNLLIRWSRSAGAHGGLCAPAFSLARSGCSLPGFPEV